MRSVTIWLGAAILLLACGLAGLSFYYRSVVNPEVVRELREEPAGPRAQLVMLLTFADGRELPVNYLRDGNRVFVGADGPWWREFRDGDVAVSVLIRGETLHGRARTVLDDPDYKRQVFERLRPNVPDWLPEWLDANLVVIELDQHQP